MNRWTVLGFIGLVAVIGVVHATGAYPVKPEAFDLHAYWTTRDGFDYASHRAGENGAYLYSPAFAQAIRPLAQLPWPAFAMVWTGLDRLDPAKALAQAIDLDDHGAGGHAGSW